MKPIFFALMTLGAQSAFAEHPAPEIFSATEGQKMIVVKGVQPPRDNDQWQCNRVSTYQGGPKGIWRTIVVCKTEVSEN